MADRTRAWWQRGVVYQIYPRSFQDSNGDGIGDLPGILSRLDHLSWLGVEALWISPIYPSPMADFGYDIADYTDVHPIFGSLADFDRLVAAAHQRGLKVILDYVPNHTSDEHPWFMESRRSRHNPKRDWYLWRDPAPDGGPPNNWLSNFGGPGWTFDERTGQYYYHAFLPKQPDLNWRNPAVCAAMHDVLRFWMDRGVDGFRVDVMWHMIKDDQFRDNPPNPACRQDENPYHRFLPIYTSDRPEIHDVVSGLRKVLDEYPDRMMVGEIYLPVERLVAYYGADLEGVHLPFNFQLIQSAWNAHGIAEMVAEYESMLPVGGWPNWVLGNHDQHRIASRIGRAQARVAAILLLTLRGTPTMYYGDEIGMCDVPIPPGLVQDPFEKNVPGLGLGRDPERTPMQWSAAPNAGFTRGEPWLPVGEDHEEINVERQRDDPRSMLSLYRSLIAVRRAEPALLHGSYLPVLVEGDVFAYIRAAGRRFLILLNMAGTPIEVMLPRYARRGEVVVGTHPDRVGAALGERIQLRGDEGVVARLG